MGPRHQPDGRGPRHALLRAAHARAGDRGHVVNTAIGGGAALAARQRGLLREQARASSRFPNACATTCAWQRCRSACRCCARPSCSTGIFESARNRPQELAATNPLGGRTRRPGRRRSPRASFRPPTSPADHARCREGNDRFYVLTHGKIKGGDRDAHAGHPRRARCRPTSRVPCPDERVPVRRHDAGARRSIASTSPRSRRWMRDNVEGFAAPSTVEQFKGGQSNPTFLLARRRQALCAAPQAARQAAALGARGRPRVPRHHRARRHATCRCRAPMACARRRRDRHRPST